MAEVRLEVDVAHPPQRVWRALTDADLLGQWFMPTDFQPHTGARFTLDTVGLPGFLGPVSGEVVELHAPHRIVMLWQGEHLHTRVIWEVTGIVGGCCQLRITQTGFVGVPAIRRLRHLRSTYRKLFVEQLPAVLERLACGQEDLATAGADAARTGVPGGRRAPANAGADARLKPAVGEPVAPWNLPALLRPEAPARPGGAAGSPGPARDEDQTPAPPVAAPRRRFRVWAPLWVRLTAASAVVAVVAAAAVSLLAAPGGPAADVVTGLGGFGERFGQRPLLGARPGSAPPGAATTGPPATRAPVTGGAFSGEPDTGPGAPAGPTLHPGAPTGAPGGGATPGPGAGTSPHPAPGSPEAAPPPPPPPSSPLPSPQDPAPAGQGGVAGLTASYRTTVMAVLGLTYTGAVTIHNPWQAAVDGWTVVITLPPLASVTGASGASYHQAGTTVMLQPTAATAPVAAGQTVTFTFQVVLSTSGALRPLSCTIDGRPCSGIPG